MVNHTPDNYPVCDWVLGNAYAMIDSGHGFKMLALGRLAAADLLGRRAAARSVPPRPLRPGRNARRVGGPLPLDLKRRRRVRRERERLGREEPGSVLRGPPITIICECGEGATCATAAHGLRAVRKRSNTRRNRRGVDPIRGCSGATASCPSRSAWSSSRWRCSSRSPATSSACSSCCRWR